MNIMDLKADISWIRSELKNVKDPHLIEAFKQLLTYRKSKIKERFTKSEFVADIKEAEDQIKKGDFRSIEDFERDASQWS